MPALAKADPEAAAATFRLHLDEFWASGRPQSVGMERIDLDPLHTVIGLKARRADGTQDLYFVALGAEYYDSYPPTVMFVEPRAESQWCEAKEGTSWYPVIKFPNPPPPQWFQLHAAYSIDGYSQPRQLVCFSFTAEYYMTSHNPTESQRWTQGVHTVAGTLNRLQEVLSAPLYQRPSA